MPMLKDLLRLMDAKIFKPENDTHEKLLELQAARIKRLLLAFMISSQITCGMWALKPLFDDADRKFPFDMWMPVSPEDAVQYYIGYAFQLGTICISAYMYFGVDSVTFSSVIFGCAQIDIIKDKLMSSENLHRVLYKCYWYEQDVKFKRDLCFAMMRISRPLFLRAGHYIILSRQTFVAILRMSYSYFAVLNQAQILAAQALKIKRLCLFFLTSATTTCTLWAMIPLFDDASKRSFPFRIWMPVTPLKSPDYELGYLYQMVSIYISAFLFISVDSVAVCMIMFGCAELEIIMDKIQMIQSIFDSNQSDEGRKEVIKMNNKLLDECIKQHQMVGRLIQLCEDTYHANIFFQLSGTVAIICNIGLRISIVEKNSVQFFSMLNYMVTMLSQLFLYCWCGHELTIRSENLREWLYQCPWYEQDTKFKRSLFIAMERMKKPIIFKAGHYISLSRPTFVAILRCSYSYFAVLNRVNTE
ncbi:hypothetical protein HW555_008329 [Spodoptera exigua]|uniref:Odorant receptor n=1 Tax=Spodoptera exigua TaxID=7107 RepID=A0A835GE70_SPOEX|nr:hypothetical protein HW555_008329 [Spodoptera exigua]